MRVESTGAVLLTDLWRFCRLRRGERDRRRPARTRPATRDKSGYRIGLRCLPRGAWTDDEGEVCRTARGTALRVMDVRTEDARD